MPREDTFGDHGPLFGDWGALFGIAHQPHGHSGLPTFAVGPKRQGRTYVVGPPTDTHTTGVDERTLAVLASA